MEGKESQRVGKAVASPWSPRAVQALWILLTKEIKFSMTESDRVSRWGEGLIQIDQCEQTREGEARFYLVTSEMEGHELDYR
jgi:hypothetical protein